MLLICCQCVAVTASPYGSERGEAGAAGKKKKKRKVSLLEDEKPGSLLPLALKKSASASAEAKRRDMQHFFMAQTKQDAESAHCFFIFLSLSPRKSAYVMSFKSECTRALTFQSFFF